MTPASQVAEPPSRDGKSLSALDARSEPVYLPDPTRDAPPKAPFMVILLTAITLGASPEMTALVVRHLPRTVARRSFVSSEANPAMIPMPNRM